MVAQFQATDGATAKQFATTLKSNPTQVFPSSIFGIVKVSSVKVIQGLTVGQQVGIALGVTAAAAGCLVTAFFWWYRLRSDLEAPSLTPPFPRKRPHRRFCQKIFTAMTWTSGQRKTPSMLLKDEESTTKCPKEVESEELSLRQLYDVKDRLHPPMFRPTSIRPEHSLPTPPVPDARLMPPTKNQADTVYMFSNPLATEMNHDRTVTLRGAQIHGGPLATRRYAYSKFHLQMRHSRVSDRSSIETD